MKKVRDEIKIQNALCFGTKLAQWCYNPEA